MADEQPGATGDFPSGKLREDDKGGLRIGVGSHEGKVIVDFGANPVTWIGMDPSDARGLAAALNKRADDAEG